MLISFRADGSIEFTRNNDLLALFPDDKKSIKRMTEIIFDENKQRFKISILLGPHRGHRLTWSLYWHYLPLSLSSADWEAGTAIMHYRTYEDAVADEIKFVDAVRVTGESMHQ